MSLFIIVMVGVGSFMGIQESAPDIASALNKYNGIHRLMDLQIVSTMGLTDDDVNALKALKNIKAVIPSYSIDVLSHNKTIRVQPVEKSVNTIELINGHMPKSDNECIADCQKYKIGDKVIIDGNVSNELKNTEFHVVGTVRSPLYFSYDYGKTIIGDGKLYSFIFINKNNFTMDAYTQINIISSKPSDIAAFSKGYDNVITQINNELLKIK